MFFLFFPLSVFSLNYIFSFSLGSFSTRCNDGGGGGDGTSENEPFKVAPLATVRTMRATSEAGGIVHRSWVNPGVGLNKLLPIVDPPRNEQTRFSSNPHRTQQISLSSEALENFVFFFHDLGLRTPLFFLPGHRIVLGAQHRHKPWPLIGKVASFFFTVFGVFAD